MNVNKAVSFKREAASGHILRGNGRGDNREKWDGWNDGDITEQEASNENTNIGSEQMHCTAETYVSVRGERSGRDHQRCSVKCGVDVTARNVGGKVYDERNCEMNMATGETEKQTKHDRKQQLVMNGNDKTT